MSRLFPREIVEQALKDAAWIAEHGTREEKSGRFLPPPGWVELEVRPLRADAGRRKVGAARAV